VLFPLRSGCPLHSLLSQIAWRDAAQANKYRLWPEYASARRACI